MNEYYPGVFKQCFSEPPGPELWAFLNEQQNVIRMETATRLGRPAIEGLEDGLIERFGEAILPDRVKQMVGHMVRQVMEARDYELDSHDARIATGGPFVRASRYSKIGENTFHVFRSSSDQRSLALCFDRSGASLPESISTQGERWRYWRSFQGSLRGSIVFGIQDLDKARDEITKKGYFTCRLNRILRAGRR